MNEDFNADFFNWKEIVREENKQFIESAGIRKEDDTVSEKQEKGDVGEDKEDVEFAILKNNNISFEKQDDIEDLIGDRTIKTEEPTEISDEIQKFETVVEKVTSGSIYDDPNSERDRLIFEQLLEEEKNDNQDSQNNVEDDNGESIEDELQDINGEDQQRVDQVGADLFGYSTEESDEVEDQEELDNVLPGKREKEQKKVSFKELRTKGGVPRLRKSLVLTIMISLIGIFLLLVNILIGMNRREQERLERERQSFLEEGDAFTLGDYKNRVDDRNEDNYNEPDDIFIPKAPPAYDPIPAARPASERPSVATVPRTAAPLFSESDLEAIRARIKKEGGYGDGGTTGQIFDPGMSNINTINQGIPGSAGTIPSRDEYMSQRINDIASLVNAAGGGGSRLREESDNNENKNNGRYTQAGNYNSENQGAGEISYLTDTALFPGTIIHAVLQSRIDTDYPGPIFARVTENVYDSKTGKRLLIPQGTILMGDYSSSSIGVAKVQVGWKQMIVNYNDVAYSVSLGGMAGVDKSGRAGIAGTLDDHYFEWLKAAGIVSLFTMLNSEVSYQMGSQSNSQIRELLGTNQAIAGELGTRIMERALDIQPTVRVANGKSVSVAVNAVLYLRPFDEIKAEQQYVRH
jgi:type IV secretion system protein VirB10